MQTQIDKAQRVIDLVRSTKAIDRTDTARLCEIQDILNINGEEAERVWKALKATNDTKNLVWIIANACGFETLEFYIYNGWLKFITEKLRLEAFEEAREDLQWAFDQQAKAQAEIFAAAQANAQEAAALAARKAALDEKERNYRLKADKAAGLKVNILRKQVKRLEQALATEKGHNRRARLVVKYLSK